MSDSEYIQIHYVILWKYVLTLLAVENRNLLLENDKKGKHSTDLHL